MRKPVAFCVYLLSVLVPGLLLAQGGFSPTGAPSATFKTLQQVEPRIDLATVPGDAGYEHIITNSGSYYLSDNLHVTKARGINIEASGVTLDLNGFEVADLGGSAVTAIRIGTGISMVRVHNGSVTGFSYGVAHTTALPFGDGNVIENISAANCTTAIYGGQGTVVKNCSVESCDFGIFNMVSANISGCQVQDFAIFGIYVYDGSVVENCTVSQGAGNTAIGVGQGSVVSRCTTYSNTLFSGAINAGPNGSVVESCAVYQNQGAYGIAIGNGGIVRDCVVFDNQLDAGISVSSGSTVTRCAVRDNVGSEAFTYGITGFGDCTVVECVVTSNSHTNSPNNSNQGIGIRVSGTSIIRDCLVKENSGDGIQVQNLCSVRDNSCVSNGQGPTGDGAGIHVLGEENRIIGNQVSFNDRGIDVDDKYNFIVRNTASGNTIDYDIVASNKVGTILAPMDSPAINGSTGGVGVAVASFGGLGGTPTDDSWANFSF